MGFELIKPAQCKWKLRQIAREMARQSVGQWFQLAGVQAAINRQPARIGNGCGQHAPIQQKIVCKLCRYGNLNFLYLVAKTFTQGRCLVNSPHAIGVGCIARNFLCEQSDFQAFSPRHGDVSQRGQDGVFVMGFSLCIKCCRVTHRARDHAIADDVDRQALCHLIHGQTATAGLQTHQPAAGRWNSNGSATVIGMRNRHHTSSHQGSRTA